MKVVKLFVLGLFITSASFGNKSIESFLKGSNVNFTASENNYVVPTAQVKPNVLEDLKTLASVEGYKLGLSNDGSKILVYYRPTRGPGSPIKGLCIPCPQPPSPGSGK